jgi:hypothetical protein
MGNLLRVGRVGKTVMAVKRSANVGLSHPTVIPADVDTDGNEETTSERARVVCCPACGRPLGEH